MKHGIIFLSIIALVFSTVLSALTVFAANEPNLMTNESVETATTLGTPAAWRHVKSGINTATFQYKTGGHTGNRSLYASIQSRQTGSVKWMPNAATVQPNTEYTYTEWYKASATSRLDLQYTATTGAVRVATIKSLPKSTIWSQFTVTFVTPADVAKVVPMHTLATIGWVQTDDFSLRAPTPVTPPIDQENLIANNSFEQTVNDSPDKWNKNSWGTNAATFSYETSGRTGSRSAKVAMGAYTDGDAKWYAEPVGVVAGKNYVYRDYYKATVPTRIVVSFLDSANNAQYLELPAAATAIDWTQYSSTFTVPTTAVKASVYHLIDRTGALALDDVSLSVGLPTQDNPTVPNASLETSLDSITPDYWQKSSWGTNSPSYSYVNEGHTGSKSVKVTMSNYVDGDAKWFFNPINTMKSGSQYRFTTWYKANVSPHPVAMFIMADGSEQYSAMPIAQRDATNSDWQKYSDTFSVPTGAVSGSVFMYINENGWLQTDDYSLEEYHANGFSRPLLTMTFDDGHEDNATTALPLLNQYGFKTTQCFATSFIEGQSQAVKNGVLAFKNAGHEICSHTVTHPFLTTMTPASMDYELQHSKQYLEQLIGAPVVNFASPYGDYNASVINEIKKYYRSHRSVDEGYNSKDNFNIYSLRVQNILDTTSAAQVTAWINQAQASNTWLILVYHRIASNPGPYDSYTNVFSQHLSAIKNTGITVKTYQDALNEVTTQL